MKLNKMIINRFAAAALALISSAAVVFTSCNNSLINTTDALDSDTGTVTFSINDGDRSVNPDVSVSDFSGITITYKSTSAAQSDEATTLVSGKTYEEFTAGTYKVTAGEIEFTAAAVVNELTYIATATQTIKALGTNNVSLVFALDSAADTVVSGTGYIDVEFALNDTSVKGVKAVLQKYADKSVAVEEKQLPITDNTFSYVIGEGSSIAEEIDTGSYRLIIEFYSDEDCSVCIGMWKDVIHVTKGFTSKAEYTITDASKTLYTVTFNTYGATLADGVTLPTSVTAATQYTLPTSSEISRKGFDFEGWYLDADFTETSKVTELKNITADTTVYSKWLCKNYLTFKGNEAFSLSKKQYCGTDKWDGTIYYSTDKITWNEWDGSTSIDAAVSDENYYIYLNGKNTYFSNSASVNEIILTESDGGDTLEVECSGNIMSLLDFEDPDSASLTEHCFQLLFLNCTALVSAPEFPATTLADWCYANMFGGCTKLQTPPELPATTLAYCCYNSMFVACSALQEVPELPATELAEFCYAQMFDRCTALTSTTELPATTVKRACYYSMFNNCTSLVSVKKISATDIDAYKALQEMFYQCTSLQVEQQDTATDDSFITINTATGESAVEWMFYQCQTTGITSSYGNAEAGKSYRIVQ